MIFPPTLVYLNGIAKLWTFEGEGSKWPNRQYHTLQGELSQRVGTALSTATNAKDI